MAGEYRSENRWGRIFGNGTLIGDHNDAFFKKGVAGQVTELGWSNGCPRKNEVVSQYGLDWIKSRYADTNFWFKYIQEMAKIVNPAIYDQLAKATPRLPGEPVGKYEPQSVPRAHLEQIYPMSGLYSYALSRVLIEQIGRGQDRSQSRLISALDILDETIAISSTPSELLARLSDRTISADADPRDVLGHILPAEILEEENCQITLREFINDLQNYAPALMALYKNLTPPEEKGLGVIPKEYFDRQVERTPTNCSTS